MPGPRRRLQALALGCAAATIAGELLVRAFRPQCTLATVREAQTFYRRGGPYPLTLQPGVRLHTPGDPPVLYDINDLGLRDRSRRMEKAPGIRRVLCLGDSFTFGQGVAREDAWPARLEARLGPGWEVWNAGYAAGFSPDAYALFARTDLAAFMPDALIVQLFPWNDLDDIRNNLWLDLDPQGRPRRIESTVTYVDAEGRRFSTAHYPLRLRVPFLGESHLFQLAARVVTSRTGLEPPPPSSAYSRQVHQRRTAFIHLMAWPRFETSLEDLSESARRLGIPIVFLLVPTGVQVFHSPENIVIYHRSPEPFDPDEPDRRIRSWMDARGMAHAGPLERTREGVKAGRWGLADLYQPDGHWTARGHDEAAACVAESPAFVIR